MPNTPSVELPDVGSLGPAMLALPTDNMRAFVCALMEAGDNNHKRAAIAAGYQGNDNTLQVTAHRLAHDDRVLAAMHEESVRRLNTGKVMAVSTLLTLVRDAQKDSDKLKAIEMVLNRVGMHGQSEHKVTVNDVSRTDAAMIDRIKQLAAKMGLDADKLLGEQPSKATSTALTVIEAEFTEVEGSSDGLEDLI